MSRATSGGGAGGGAGRKNHGTGIALIPMLGELTRRIRPWRRAEADSPGERGISHSTDPVPARIAAAAAPPGSRSTVATITSPAPSGSERERSFPSSEVFQTGLPVEASSPMSEPSGDASTKRAAPPARSTVEDGGTFTAQSFSRRRPYPT